MLASQRCLRANVLPLYDSMVYVPTCLRTRVIYVPMCLHANFSFLCVNVPINLPMCQTACQCQTFLLRNAERNFYALLLYKKFLIILDTIVMQIIYICAVHKNCIMLTSILPVVSKSVEFFSFFLFYFSFFYVFLFR